MRAQQISLLGLLFLALMGADSARGQSSPVPLGPAVEIDRTCTYSPTIFEVDGQVVAVWRRIYNPNGFWARRGPSLAELGPATLLYDQIAFGDVQAAVQPGGFVLAWAGEGGSTTTAGGLSALPIGSHAGRPGGGGRQRRARPLRRLLVDAAGEVTVAFSDRRAWSRPGAIPPPTFPLTPLIDVGPEVYDGVLAVTRLAAGDDGFPGGLGIRLARLLAGPLGARLQLGRRSGRGPACGSPPSSRTTSTWNGPTAPICAACCRAR